MTPQTTSLNEALRFAAGSIVVSAVAAVGFLIWGHIPSVRGSAGGVGIMAALFGTGVASWFSIRTRDRSLRIAAVLSLLPLAFWCWVVYEVVNG
jgi:predicted aconitase with swiveling domain